MGPASATTTGGPAASRTKLPCARWSAGSCLRPGTGAWVAPVDFLSDKKTRRTLVMTMVNYLDRWGENDPLKTVALASGAPAVELSFSFPLGLRTRATDEELMACGHLDRVVEFNEAIYIADIKTTESTISSWWFQRFSPDNQFSMYTLAGKIVWDLPISGVIVDGVQIMAGGNKFERQVVPRSATQVQEWTRGLHWWMRSMESCAEEGEWPMNDKSCALYGGCPFRSTCARPPAAREAWLGTEFVRRQWDPLERRGNPEG